MAPPQSSVTTAHFDMIRLWMSELQRKADEIEQAHKDQQTAQQMADKQQADQGMPQ